ncbi:MAG: hypothetical protein SNJ78_05055 [Spirochaetales bacterium]
MKRIVWIILSLIILAGVIFFFGWISLSLPSHTWAVSFSKSSGWEESIYEPGHFYWRWQRLIPGNFSLYLYPIQSYSVKAISKGTLPSASVYAEVLEGSPSFAFSLEVHLQFVPKKDTFVQLVRSEKLTPDNWEQWIESKKQHITAFILDRILQQGLEKILASDPSSPTDVLKQFLSEEWEKAFPYFQLQSLMLSEYQFPDLELYQKGKKLYFAKEEVRREAFLEQTRKNTIETLLEEQKIERLKRYGELLKIYPNLLEFLALEKLEKISPQDLKHLRELRE